MNGTDVNISKSLVIAALLFTCCSKKELEQGIEVALLSATNNHMDANVLLVQAPLPRPCKKLQNQVTFCTKPYPLTMVNSRYNQFSKAWGQRKSKRSHLRKLTQVGEHHFILSLQQGNERPLVWLAPNKERTLRLFPVVPELSQLQHLATTKSRATFIPLSNDTAELYFPIEVAKPLSQIRINWEDDGLLHIRFVAPESAFRILIDPGHGGVKGGGAVRGELIEGELNMQLASILAESLSARGAEIEFTRTEDEELSLTNRLAKARDHRFSLFISIHHDAAEYEQFKVRPYCMYARSDLAKLCQAVTESVADMYGERISYTKRYLFVLQGYEVPSILFEALNIMDPKHIPILKDPSRRSQFFKKWSERVASSIIEQLSDARTAHHSIDKPPAI